MSIWGPLANRYENRDVPRRMLALDGGGIRGVLTLQILAALERQLARKLDRPNLKLADFFDYIGGTSTGAIIAAGLARGMSVDELIEFYTTVGPAMFERESLHRRLNSRFKKEPLVDELTAKFGAQTTLHPEHLRCLLMIVTRNSSTDSPWPISSNPLARYNSLDRADCNLRIPLWQLVRASTAAPFYFPPEVVSLDDADPSKTFVFCDGGVTAYNNPAFLLYRMAVHPAYRLEWQTGEKNLLLVSVGTGAVPVDQPDLTPADTFLGPLARLPSALISTAQIDQDIVCRTVGRCVFGAPIDRELGDLIPRTKQGEEIPLSQDLGRAFLYARYNTDLTTVGLRELGLGGLDVKRVQKLDAIDAIDDLSAIGRALAAKSVNVDQYGGFVSPPPGT
jgi:hypothetical protein